MTGENRAQQHNEKYIKVFDSYHLPSQANIVYIIELPSTELASFGLDRQTEKKWAVHYILVNSTMRSGSDKRNVRRHKIQAVSGAVVRKISIYLKRSLNGWLSNYKA